MSITQKEVGERLRARRKQLGLTIAAVAAKIGDETADSTVQRTEVGTQNPTLATFLAHCAAVEVSPATILDGKIPLSIRPTVQEALDVLREYIEMTGTIIKKFSAIEQELSSLTPEQLQAFRKQLPEYLKSIRENLEPHQKIRDQKRKPS